MAATHPHLAAEFHPTRNGAITPSSTRAKTGRKLWWLCPDCTHEWSATGNNRAHGTGCPRCTKNGGFKCDEPAVLYVLCGDQFGKIGISNTSAFQKRINHHTNAGIYGPLATSFTFRNGEDALAVETNLKRLIRERWGPPNDRREGWTEAFPVGEIAELLVMTHKQIKAIINK
jgi:hypothetical protein